MRRMAVRFWTLLFLVSLACIFKKKWNLVSGNHNPKCHSHNFQLICYQGTRNKEYLVFDEFWSSTSHSLHKLALLLLRHSPKLNEFTAFRRRYRVESRPSSKARKNRKHVYKSISSKKECRSVALRENFYLLKQTVTTKHFHIFTVSESWQDRTVCDTDILIPGYTTFRQDRGPHKRGGGVLVYVKDMYKACVIEKWSSVSESNFQQLWLKVQCKKFKSFFLCIQFTCHRILPSIS